jgi:hypothetical protein
MVHLDGKKALQTHVAIRPRANAGSARASKSSARSENYATAEMSVH